MHVVKSFAALLYVCFAVSAFAKLGEPVPQLIKRFGKTYTVEEIELGKAYRFRSANVSVDVVVSNGRSISETYFSDHPLNASGEPPNDIVRAVLRTNAPEARWTEIAAAPFRADYALRSSDGEYVAILNYTRPQPENTIWTMTVGRANVVGSLASVGPSLSPPVATPLITPAPTPSVPASTAPVIMASPKPVARIGSSPLRKLEPLNVLTTIIYVYIFSAVIISICLAQVLEKRLKARFPETLPYRWGYYFGCANLACAPFAFLFACFAVIFALSEKPELFGQFSVYAAYLGLLAICGWFIIKRRWWAWVCGTILSFNLVLWIINSIYGRKRRKELSRQYVVPATVTPPAEPGPSVIPDASRSSPVAREHVFSHKAAALLFLLFALFFCTIVIVYFRPWAQSQAASQRQTQNRSKSSADSIQFQPVPLPELVKLIRPSVVRILGYKNGQLVQTGSGFFVGKNGDIATNFHVIDGVDNALVKLSDGATYEVVDVLSYSQGADIAILETFAMGPKPLSLSTNLPEVGERIYVLGNPASFEGSLSDGLVSAKRRDDYGALVQISAPISHGSSGSPVFNEWGVVVGIATMVFEPGQSLNFARSAGTIRAMLESSSSPLRFDQLEQQLIAGEKQAFDADPERSALSKALSRKDWAAAVAALAKLSNKYPRLDFIKENLSEALAHRALDFAIAGDYDDALSVAKLAVQVRDTKYARDALSLIAKGAAMRR
jgi:S1-C subfamily serine protease